MPMRKVDAIVVGGGPAGSACATRLVDAGIDCLVLDRESFPRLKLCAGWVTPEAVEDLALDPEIYPHSFLTFDELIFHLGPFTRAVGAKQHSIRRIEFDAWLLERSGAPVETHNVRRIDVDDDGYTIDDAFRCRWVIGAGGTRCPVYRTLFRSVHERPERLQAAVLEEEFPFDGAGETCHLWFCRDKLPGYSWYVPKAGGHLNVGVGGISTKLKARGQTIRQHWETVTADVGSLGVGKRGWDPGGYTYYCRPPVERVRLGNAFLCGDAAGLATRDLFEGIGPAVRSGQRAADAIIKGKDYDLGDVSAYSCPPGLARRALEYLFVTRRS
jgi:menaquinone-9 beta-reductase